MAQTLPKDVAEERLRWIMPYLDGTAPLRDLASRSPFSYRTLKRWLGAYRSGGTAGLLPASRKPRSHPRQFERRTTARIRTLRKETGLGPDVLAPHLLRREGISVSARGVAKVLRREGLVRTRKRLTPKERWKPRATVPGELVEVDGVYARKFKDAWLYQFTAVDCCTRWRHLWMTPEQSTRTAVQFLAQVCAAAPFPIRTVKTDNSAIFTNRHVGYPKSTDPLRPRLHPFDVACAYHHLTHYLIAPGRPAQNGTVERSHRNDRAQFWNRVSFRTVAEVRRKHAAYCTWYNTVCPHLALAGKTPIEYLQAI